MAILPECHNKPAKQASAYYRCCYRHYLIIVLFPCCKDKQNFLFKQEKKKKPRYSHSQEGLTLFEY
jgi:hypothetical protein